MGDVGLARYEPALLLPCPTIRVLIYSNCLGDPPTPLLMPRSHWAFLASLMHSRWKLTSIRRCSGGITKPSANNLNSWYSWGSISLMPKIFNACFETFHEPLAMFCLEKCSANIRRWSATNRGIFAEQSPNICRYFLIWDASAISAKYLRNIGDYSPTVSSFATFWKTFAIFAHLRPTYVRT